MNTLTNPDNRMSQNFYKDLPSFQNFNQFTNDVHFTPLPKDWTLLLTDVKGSTKAIASGRYKEVNTMGAATIVVVTKVLKDLEYPFVFGGDGATVLVPNLVVDQVKENLLALKKLAKDQFDLDLRVGAISMHELTQRGKSISVAKFTLTPGKSIAILKGEGISEAENLIKHPAAQYEVTGEVKAEADLTGLSCRWNPIPSKHGTIMTLIVKSRKGDEVYGEFLQELERVLPHGLENANPTNVDVASYKSLSTIIKEERKLHERFSMSLVGRCVEAVLAVLIFKFGVPPLIFNSRKYADSMRTHSDFRKFDDYLRMVIDCRKEDATSIINYLQAKFEEHDLFYGIHETGNSLMTCFVNGLGQGEHIHFIDAENGGYTAAATELKKQIQALTKVSV